MFGIESCRLVCEFVRKYIPAVPAVWRFLPEVTFLNVASVVCSQVPPHARGTGAIWEHGSTDQAARELPAEPAEDQSVPQPSWDGEGDTNPEQNFKQHVWHLGLYMQNMVQV